MTFAEAVKFLVELKAIKRASWRYNDSLFISKPYNDGQRYLLINNCIDQLSYNDIAADDWEVVE